MYKNLEAEMARTSITRNNISELLDVRYATVIDKMKGRYSFSLDEAMKIQKTFFPDNSIEYLFERENRSSKLEVN